MNETLKSLRSHAEKILKLVDSLDSSNESQELKVEFTMDFWYKIEDYLKNGTAETLFEGIAFPSFSDNEFRARKPHPTTGSHLPTGGVSYTFKFLLQVFRTEINRIYPKSGGGVRSIYCTVQFGKNGGWRWGHPDYPMSHAPSWLPDLNRDAGGAKLSTHKKLDNNGKLAAGDFNVEGLTTAQIWPIANKIFKYGGVGKGTSKLIHLDYDGSGKWRRWNY